MRLRFRLVSPLISPARKLASHLFKHVVMEAERLGLEITLNAGPGRKPYTKDSPLLPSGLLGPVTIRIEGPTPLSEE